ncbi:MAG: DnaJ domain-containing protein [Brevinematia bacterium]
MEQIKDKNYYKILGIDRNATIREIKSAYRKLVMKYHPDVSRSRETEEMFKLINEAYNVLSNPKLRENYDKKLNLEVKVEDNIKHTVNSIMKTISNGVKVVVREIQKMLEEISADKTLEKLSNEELLQRVSFSDNEMVKIAALKIIKARKRRSTIPYLLEIMNTSENEKLKKHIQQTLRDLGHSI